jgi:hypothetical protein
MEINRFSATGEILLEKDMEIRVELLDEDGIVNKNPVTISIEALQDQRPQVVYKRPRRDLNLGINAFFDFTGRASDDFGIERMELHRARVDVEGKHHFSSVTIDRIDEKDIGTKDFKRRIDFRKIKAQAGEVYKYELFAQDHLKQWGAGRQLAIHIVHEETLMEELENDLSAIRKILERMIAREEKNIEITSGIMVGLPKVNMGELNLVMDKQKSLTKLSDEIIDIMDRIVMSLKRNRIKRSDISDLLLKLNIPLQRFISTEQKALVSHLVHLKENGQDLGIISDEKLCLKTFQSMLNIMGGSRGFREVIEDLENIIEHEKSIHQATKKMKNE